VYAAQLKFSSESIGDVALYVNKDLMELSYVNNICLFLYSNKLPDFKFQHPSSVLTCVYYNFAILCASE
jgi:hypothetical protein